MDLVFTYLAEVRTHVSKLTLRLGSACTSARDAWVCSSQPAERPRLLQPSCSGHTLGTGRQLILLRLHETAMALQTELQEHEAGNAI